MSTTTLYRPVGKREMELILLSNSKAFPPRLNWQPIFYPVLNFDYAAQIAREWNTPDEFSGYVGFVTRFDVDSDYLKKFDVQTVGAEIHQELWIPSEELEEFNSHIVGYIQLEYAYYGQNYKGDSKECVLLQDLNVDNQFVKIKEIVQENDLSHFFQSEKIPLLLNFGYWFVNFKEQELLEQIRKNWEKTYPELTLPKAEMV